MSSLQQKLEMFLSTDYTISEEIIEQATKTFNEKLSKFNHVKKGSSNGLPSMSQVGKPMCQLQASKLGWKQSPKPDHFKIMMAYGDMTEVIAVAILLSAGIKITDMNKKVMLPTKVGNMYGELDLIIELEDKTVWDIKSASSWSFDKKFSSYEQLKRMDDFGYCCQLFGYAKAEGVKAGGWIVINKGTGQMKIVEADQKDEDYFLDKIEKNALQVSKTTEESHFERSFEDTLETYYKKSTGNRKLQMPCTFCDYKFSCWKDLKYLKNPVSKAGNYEYYTQMASRYGG